MLPTSGTAVLGPYVTLTPFASWLLIVFEVDCVITSVGTKVSPPPYENEPGSPGATSPIRTPIAPAFAARSTLRLTAQVPRSIRAILPAGFERYGSPGQPRPTKVTSPVVSVFPIGAQPTVEVFLYSPAIAAGEFTFSA